SEKSHHTNLGIRENQTFSINIPSTDMVKITDHCGMVSGKDKDKSEFFKSFYGKSETAPMIEECSINIECKVIKSFEINEMEVFIADVVKTYVEETCIVDGRIDIKKVDPLIYAYGGSYWSVGEMVDLAFKNKELK
ncbi:MAG: flavin reductase family protein, partial [Candidatus Delongbacteria bacterium]|nr:flavin reductase family protein [Candidatus Delongbacteria bacterium]